jgi:lysophospholipase L1-like esterase
MAWRSENAFPASVGATETCRFVALLTGAGSRVRAEFTAPLASSDHYTIERAAISLSSGAHLDVVPGTSRYLTFGGKPSAAASAGKTLVTDAVPMRVRNGTSVAVTLVVSAGASPASGTINEPSACTTSAVPSILTAAGATFNTVTNPRWLGDIQVFGPKRRSIAAFGDSTTGSTPPGTPPHARWSDALTGYGATVVNAGVSGGALTRLGVFDSIPGMTRMANLLKEPNLTDVVILIGENDITDGVPTNTILTGIGNVLLLAKQRHVQAWVMTLLPRVGSLQWTTTTEQARQDINRVLRSSSVTSRGGRTIDADAFTRYPVDPRKLLPAYDAGDHAHLNAAGSRALGTYVARTIGLIK